MALRGPEVTHHLDRFLENGADVIAIGEGEEVQDYRTLAWSKTVLRGHARWRYRRQR